MTTDESTPLNLVKTVLRSLAKKRSQGKGWKDAEEEVSDAQAFKLGEALRPFYLVAAQEFDRTFDPGLSKHDLIADTGAFFASIRKDGFFPSPYSPVATNDQYTDFAAFALDFADLVLRYPSQASLDERKIKGPARSCIQKALNFLTNKGTYLEDSTGVRWAGTITRSRTIKGKVEEFFTDTYFTANVVVALNRALGIKTVTLSQDQKTLITELIRKAGKWIAGREKHGLITADEDRKNPQLFYSTWGLRALAETYHLQETAVRDALKAVVATYIDALRQVLDEKGVTVTQDYITVCSTELSQPLPYEERSSWAGIILALVSLGHIQELESTLEDTDYRRVLDDVTNGLMALRDPLTDLWYRDYFIVSIHSVLVEALIARMGLPQRLGYTYEVSSALVDRVVNEALADTRLVKLMQQLVYEKMSRIAIRREQQRKLSAGFSDTPKPTKSKSKTLSRQKKP